MAETPRDYKKRIDAKWRMNERKKNKLIEKIKEYELFDEWYKEKIKKEIMDNFLKNEKEEKEGSEYVNALTLIKITRGRYDELEQKRENLRHLEEEREEIEKKIDEYEVDLANSTMINMQKMKIAELSKNFDSIKKKVVEARKDVEEMEEEIKAMEESYGKMEDVESDEADIIEVGNEEMAGDGLEKGLIGGEDKKVTLEEYRKNTLSDLREKDRVRKEIIELLNEGVGIDDKLRDRVKEEVKNKYDEYSKEKLGNIEMKSANLLENRLKNRKERYEKIKSMPEGEEKKKALETLVKEEKTYGVESLVEMWRKRDEEKREREEKERKEMEERERKERERKEKAPMILESLREKWKNEIKVIDSKVKRRIINLVDKTQVKVKLEEDGSRLVEFKMGGKWYSVLDVNLNEHTSRSYYVGGKGVMLYGMIGDYPDGWANRPLAEYVKEKNREGFSIPTEDGMKDILDELGSEANLEKESEQIAMLMYLTGIYGNYWLDYDGLVSIVGGESAFYECRNKIECQYGDGKQSCRNVWRDCGGGEANYLFLLSVKDAEEVEREEREKREEEERKKRKEEEARRKEAERNEETVEEVTDPKIEEQIDSEIEEVEEIEDTGDTPRKIRENLIMEWYEKKLNRDELLRVLWGIETIDKEKRKKVEEEIIKEFYVNYEKAKNETEGYEEAEEMYRGKGEKKGIKKVGRELESKEKEVKMKKEETKGEIEEIESGQLDMALKVAELRDKNVGWWKRMRLEKKLRNIDEKREELREREDKINKEIGELEKDKKELEKKLKKQEKEYGGKIARGERNKRVEKGYGGVDMEEVKREKTLKGYKEKYEKMVKDKEEYMKEFMKRLKDMEIGVSDERKKEVMEMVEKGLNEEIARLKEGDETMKKAKEVEKWLKENMEKKMEELSELEKKMEEKEKELDEIKSRMKGENISTEVKIERKKQLLEIGGLFAELKDRSDEIKLELDEKYRLYYGCGMSRENKREGLNEYATEMSEMDDLEEWSDGGYFV